jgi:tetratricopeptide repeat protein 12
MGNQAFRNGEFEKAVSMYSKAIDQVRDSPILYNNRALSFIRLSLFKRAIIDCDFVINKLDEKNLRAWLYRAKAYYLLDEKRLYEKCIFEAKKHHPKELSYIGKIVIEIEGVGEGDESGENCEEDEGASTKGELLTK